MVTGRGLKNSTFWVPKYLDGPNPTEQHSPRVVFVKFVQVFFTRFG